MELQRQSVRKQTPPVQRKNISTLGNRSGSFARTKNTEWQLKPLMTYEQTKSMCNTLVYPRNQNSSNDLKIGCVLKEFYQIPKWIFNH